MIPADLTRIGHLLAPHGVQGGIKLFMLGEPEQLLGLARVYVEGRGWLRVRRKETLAPGLVFHLAGIESREAAEGLRGLKVYAADQELPALEEGSYYFHQLRGLEVLDPTGAARWQVRDVLDMGHQDLLVVESDEGKEYYLPLQAPYVQVQENGQGEPMRIQLREDTPEGLLDEQADSDDEASVHDA